MDRRMVSKSLILTAASLGAAWPGAWADEGRERPHRFRGHDHDHGHDDDDDRASVTVSFGGGLNTAQPGNKANHHILPREIKVRQDGVVNFVVAGFHQIIVFKPGVVLGQIVVPPPAVPPAPPILFVFDPAPPSSLPVLYLGLRTAGGPPPGTPETIEPSNASNRVESVLFPEAGNYLVMCNVLPHFNDGMWAIVKVR